MARKRRYYREERRRPTYWEEDEDDFEEDESPEDTDKFVRNSSWILLAVLVLGIALSVAQSFYVPSSSVHSGNGYRVVSVSRGKLHTEEVATGRAVSFDDQHLVKAALSGSIKRGDIIQP